MLEQCITSFIDGRVRLRHPALHDLALAAQVEGLLTNIPGVRAVTVRPRAGSLLLEYDPEQLDKESLLDMLRQWEGLLGLSHPARSPLCPKGKRPLLSCLNRATTLRTINRGMLVSLAASLGFLAAGQMRGHAVASGIFVALSACHMGAYRKQL